MSARTPFKLVLPVALIAAGVLLALENSDHAPSGATPAPVSAAPVRTRARATTRRQRPNRRQTSVAPRSLSAGQVARYFLAAWLRCTYHQAPCFGIPGTLPAYAAALAGQQGRSLATPAEFAARPRFESLSIVHSCAAAAIAVATYTDGHGRHFPLHVNLVREPAGWRVFDVAEAPPHIALPNPLTAGPQAC